MPPFYGTPLYAVVEVMPAREQLALGTYGESPHFADLVLLDGAHPSSMSVIMKGMPVCYVALHVGGSLNVETNVRLACWREPDWLVGC
jgi:hypothetical protein